MGTSDASRSNFAVLHGGISTHYDVSRVAKNSKCVFTFPIDDIYTRLDLHGATGWNGCLAGDHCSAFVAGRDLCRDSGALGIRHQKSHHFRWLER
ncbi:hypothetical protein D3C78_1336950 [compost metagenome]